LALLVLNAFDGGVAVGAAESALARAGPGGRAGYNRKNPYKPSGEDIALHLAKVIETLPGTVEAPRARADAGFSCWETVKAYTKMKCEFVIVVRKTGRWLGEWQAAARRRSPHTDADFECQFRYQPEPDVADPDQITLFDGLACRYRVFLTNLDSGKCSPAGVVAFYNKPAAVENQIKEANNGIGLTAHPPGQWAMNANHFQLSRIADNLNCWLALPDHAPWRADGDSFWGPVSETGLLRALDGAAQIERKMDGFAHGPPGTMRMPGAKHEEQKQTDLRPRASSARGGQPSCAVRIQGSIKRIVFQFQYMFFDQ
jgi:hypothetical protein